METKTKEKFQSFLELHGFKIIKNVNSPYFGDYYETFTNGLINLRLSRTKSMEMIDICSKNDDGNWNDLALVKALLQNQEHLNKTTTPEELCQFLENEIIEIENLFKEENYSETQKKLKEIGMKRARQMFPGKIK